MSWVECSLHGIRKVYDQALEVSLVELGLDARGVAAYEGWQADASVLRNVLRRLRGICTHPQVSRWHISHTLPPSPNLVWYRLDNSRNKVIS